MNTTDPYEIAYLKGGKNEVTRAVIFELIRRGWLYVGGRESIEYLERSPAHPDPGDLSLMERNVFSWIDDCRTLDQILSAEPPADIQRFCAACELIMV